MCTLYAGHLIVNPENVNKQRVTVNSCAHLTHVVWNIFGMLFKGLSPTHLFFFFFKLELVYFKP